MIPKDKVSGFLVSYSPFLGHCPSFITNTLSNYDKQREHIFQFVLSFHLISILANKIFAYIVQFQDVWFRVLLFLVVAPLILLHSSCWLLILRLYRWKYVSPKMTRLNKSNYEYV